MSSSLPKLVVLDRDGVINKDSDDFIKTVDEWQPIDGSLEAIARLHDAGYTVVVATNQSGVGRGLFSVDTLWDIHRKMLAEVLEAGGYIQRIFFCLHTPEDKCNCRKPKPGLMYQIADYFGRDLNGVPVIGDAERDLRAAVAVNARPMLVRTGKGETTEKSLDPEVCKEIYANLGAAADALIAEGSAE
ncbi:MAG: D-glycero-beta-D-manno-heptose 1,7-bisphosphate 7-phosphatase [Gammaproteobacteria bacterium]